MMNAHLRHSLGFKTKCRLIVARHRGGNTPFNRYADSVSRLCHAVCWGCLSVPCWSEQSILGSHIPKSRLEKQHLTHEIWNCSLVLEEITLFFYLQSHSYYNNYDSIGQLRFDWQCHIRKRVMNHKTRVKGKLTQQLTGDWYIELGVFNLAAELTRSLYNKLRCLRGNISPDGSLFSAFAPSPRLPMRGLVATL